MDLDLIEVLDAIPGAGRVECESEVALYNEQLRRHATDRLARW